MKKLYNILSLICVCLYPNLFMYFQNAGEAKIIDIGVSTALFLGTGIIVFVVCLTVLRNCCKAVALSNVTMLFVANFEIISGAFKWSEYAYVFTLIIVLIVLGVMGYIVNKVKFRLLHIRCDDKL